MAHLKNYKVVCSNSYSKEVAVYYYDWYWAADLRSWVMHNVFGFGCNTYVRDGARVKPRPVVYK